MCVVYSSVRLMFGVVVEFNEVDVYVVCVLLCMMLLLLCVLMYAVVVLLLRVNYVGWTVLCCVCVGLCSLIYVCWCEIGWLCWLLLV